MKAMDISIGPASKALQAFVQSGRKGCDAKWIMLDDGNTEVKRLSMTETRRCRKSGGEPLPDLRVLNPIQHYGEFRENGRLVSYQACDTDTPLQTKVKKARLTRMEIIAIVLYSVYYKTILKQPPYNFQVLFKVSLVRYGMLDASADLAARSHPTFSLDLRTSGNI